MGRDMRDVYEEKKASLEKAISETKLSPEQKKIILDAIELGYAGAYCVRTCDMTYEYFLAEKYKDGVEKIKKSLE